MSVERRGGGWRVRWRDDGKNRSRNFSKRSDAVAFEAEILKLKEAGEPVQPAEPIESAPSETLNQYFHGSWGQRAEHRLAPRTWRDYQYLYEKLVGPVIGDVPLDQLGVEQLGLWQAEALENWGARTVDKAHELVSSVLGDAVDTERITRNPMTRVRRPNVEHREVPPALAPLDIEKLRLAIRAVSQSRRVADRNALIISLLGYAGLRPEEMRALQWGDIRDGTLFIQRVLTKDGIQPTKTRKKRGVKLLEALRSDLEAAREALPTEPKPLDWIVTTRHGGQFTESAYESWTIRPFNRARCLIGLEDHVPYDLRHAYASLLLHEGRSANYVARQLGHSPFMTLSVYGHVIDALEDQPNISANDAITEARKAVASFELPALPTKKKPGPKPHGAKPPNS